MLQTIVERVGEVCVERVGEVCVERCQYFPLRCTYVLLAYSLPSSHAARRALRGLENTTPSLFSPSKLKVHTRERVYCGREGRGGCVL